MSNSPVVLADTGLDELIAALGMAGYQVCGPQERDGAIVFDHLEAAGSLPRGWVDDQEAGQYRLRQEGDAFFSHVVGPHSLKRFLRPARQTLWRMEMSGDGPSIKTQTPDDTRYAFFGMRACDLAALAVQDRVLGDGPFADPAYLHRRQRSFIVAVNCGRAAATCFCVSMNTGPKADAGFDIALTEIATGDDAAFLAEAGSAAGEAILDGVASRAATAEDCATADAIVAATTQSMQRRLDTDGLAELLQDNPDHPRWADAAERCLSCANCTMVCPTCFCTSVEDASALDGSETTRTQRWDSCFTLDFSYIHGGSVRPGAKARYRQWMTHKLSTWHDQFDMSGCVGCGRCIAWCPVGIDITEEAAAIRECQAAEASEDGN